MKFNIGTTVTLLSYKRTDGTIMYGKVVGVKRDCFGMLYAPKNLNKFIEGCFETYQVAYYSDVSNKFYLEWFIEKDLAKGKLKEI